MNVEERFHQAMLKVYTDARDVAGYRANYFLRDVKNKGGLATARGLLKKQKAGEIHTGLLALAEAGRPDISMEAIALSPEFRPLFTHEELTEAEQRLTFLKSLAERKPVSPSENFPDELSHPEKYPEGATRKVLVNAYERNPKARAACIAKHGCRCSVCALSFLEVYGEIGEDFIHVHHKKPLAARRDDYMVDPRKDMAPVCPNCHAMLHTQDPPLGLDELIAMMAAMRTANTSNITVH